MVIMGFFVLLFLMFISLANGRKSEEFNKKSATFCKLLECDYSRPESYRYEKYTPISNVTNIKPAGYLVYLPLHIVHMGDEALVAFTKTSEPGSSEDLYEFRISAYEIKVNKRSNDNTLAWQIFGASAQGLQLLNVLITISDVGLIDVYLDNGTKPVLSTYDPNIVPVEYASFASYYNDFFYNCPFNESDIIPAKARENETLENVQDLENLPFLALTNECKWQETYDSVAENAKYYSFNYDNQPDKYLVKLELFVNFVRQTHIYLSYSDHISYYGLFDINIDDMYHTISLSYKSYSSYTLFKQIQLPDYQSPIPRQTRILIQITRSGLLEISIGYSAYRPILTHQDDNLLNVNYFGFGSESSSKSRSIFFYDCPVPKTIPIEHPLLTGEKLTQKEDARYLNCANLKVWESVFPKFIKLSTFNNTQPDLFLLRLPFYVQTSGDAHILLTTGIDLENVYEVVLPGENTTHAFISKNNNILTEFNEVSIFNENRPVKIVLEITKDAEIRIFTDYNNLKPILEAQDTKDLVDTLQYISFGGYDRQTEYFYQCQEGVNGIN